MMLNSFVNFKYNMDNTCTIKKINGDVESSKKNNIKK